MKIHLNWWSVKQHQLAVCEIYFWATLHQNFDSIVAKWNLCTLVNLYTQLLNQMLELNNFKGAPKIDSLHSRSLFLFLPTRAEQQTMSRTEWTNWTDEPSSTPRAERMSRAAAPSHAGTNEGPIPGRHEGGARRSRWARRPPNFFPFRLLLETIILTTRSRCWNQHLYCSPKCVTQMPCEAWI
jgi:hypothetical protein